MRFIQKWYIYCKHNFHWLWMHQIGIGVLDDYQEKARIYLDEYEVEEVDLRVNFDTSLLMKRFMVKK